MAEERGRLAALKAKLKAREGKPEYKENCKHIRREIAALEGRAPEPESDLDL